MSVTELQIASKERGMRALGITKEKLTEQLKQWIELSTNEKVYKTKYTITNCCSESHNFYITIKLSMIFLSNLAHLK